MPDYQLIQLTSSGEGITTVDLSSILVRLVTRFNYQAECWTMDIFDIDDTLLAAGLMLVPQIDVLIPLTELKERIGGLMLIELNPDDYKSDSLLGINTILLWFPPGVEVVIPV